VKKKSFVEKNQKMPGYIIVPDLWKSMNCQSIPGRNVSRLHEMGPDHYCISFSFWGLAIFRGKVLDEEKSRRRAPMTVPPPAPRRTRTSRVLRAWSPCMWAHLSFHSTTTIKAFPSRVRGALHRIMNAAMRHARHAAVTVAVADRGRATARRHAVVLSLFSTASLSWKRATEW